MENSPFKEEIKMRGFPDYYEINKEVKGITKRNIKIERKFLNFNSLSLIYLKIPLINFEFYHQIF